jgi:hypothetical protein
VRTTALFSTNIVEYALLLVQQAARSGLVLPKASGSSNVAKHASLSVGIGGSGVALTEELTAALALALAAADALIDGAALAAGPTLADAEAGGAPGVALGAVSFQAIAAAAAVVVSTAISPNTMTHLRLGPPGGMRGGGKRPPLMRASHESGIRTPEPDDGGPPAEAIALAAAARGMGTVASLSLGGPL